MSITLEAVREALSAVIDPNTGKDFITTKSAKNIKIDGANVSLDIELGYPAKSQIETLRAAATAALSALPGVGQVSAHVYAKIVAHAAQGGILTGLVGIEGEHERGAQPTQLGQLLLGQARAHRGDGLVHADGVQRDHVRVPLDDHGAATLGDRAAGVM